MKFKRKLFASVLAIALAFGSAAVLPGKFFGSGSVIEASAETSGDYTYTVLDDGTVRITRYNGSGGDITVPAKLDGKAVSEVASYVFYNNYRIKSLTFSNGIKKISDRVVYWCSNLETISIPASVTDIGETAFAGCSYTTLKVSSSNQNYAASGNVLFSKDKTVLYLAPRSIGSYTVPSTVKRIGNGAFRECTGLKSITFPSGLEEISANAFSECSGLTEIKLPASVKDLGDGAFSNCSSLNKLTLQSGLESIGNYCFYSCLSLTGAALPSTLTYVGSEAFMNCNTLKTVTVPESVTSIGYHAFGYSYVGNEMILTDGFTMRCSFGSAGMGYAVRSGIAYELVDPESVDAYDQSLEEGKILDFFSLSDDYYWNEKRNGFYFAGVGDDLGKLIFLSLDTGKSEVVFDFSENNCGFDVKALARSGNGLSSDTELYEIRTSSELYRSFRQGSKLYILYNYSYYTGSYDNRYYSHLLCVFDLDTGKILNTFFPDPSNGRYTAVGADASGRIFLAREKKVTEKVTDDKTGETTERSVLKVNVDMFSPAFKKLAEAKAPDESTIYGFYGFDSASGVFAMNVYYNWIYWGYDHNMDAVALGKAGKSSVEISNYIVSTIGQQGYSSISNAAVTIGKYLCVDAPLAVSNNLLNPYSSGMSVYDIAKAYELDENCCKFSLPREYYSNPGSTSILKNGSRFARVCSAPGDDTHILAVEGSTKIAEYDAELGTEGGEIGYIITEHPVYELISGSEDVIIIMRDTESRTKYYIQKIKWTKPTKLTMSKTRLSVKVSDRKQLSATADSVYTQEIDWSSSDPKTVSVSESGVITAMKAGKAVITAKTSQGLKATCTVTVTDPALAELAGTVLKVGIGAKSLNSDMNDYSGWAASTVKSYLYENADKTFTRAEYISGNVVIENWSADCRTLLSTRKIVPELPIFGGVFFGKTYNFVVSGQKNPDQSDTAEVLRVVKYSKDWERLGAASVKGANTYVPFEAGSLRMTESNGRLYIHTCHTMYDDGDGLHHQANMTYTVRQSNMKVEQNQSEVYNYTSGYVSHSFNQFIKADGDRIYRVDQGDANPRCIFINYFIRETDPRNISGKGLASFGGGYGQNYTGANIGGFELTTHNAVVAYSSIDQSNFRNSDQYNIYLSVQDKDFKHDVKTVKLTDYAEGSGVYVAAPQIVKVSKEILLVMWQETDSKGTVAKFATVNEDGLMTSDIVSIKAGLSDCQPILCSDGLVRWYVTNNSQPTFYSVNPFYLDNISVCGLKTGDADRDGAITTKDLLLIKRYAANWKGYGSKIDLDLSDIDGDGRITSKDIMILKRCLAGWKGYSEKYIVEKVVPLEPRHDSV